MNRARCDCCGTGTGGCDLDVLKALGWSLADHAAGEQLVLLCPVCAWQRRQATEAVSVAVEAAQATRASLLGRSPGRTRRGWFWS